MGVIGEAWDFFAAGENWTGTFGIPNRVLEHLQMSGLAVVLAALVALPLGLYVGHTRKGVFFAVTIGNVGRAIPSFGILAFVFPFTLRYLPGSIGFFATLIALFLLAIPPMVTNTYVAIQAVDQDSVEAGRGMGLGGLQILRRIEIPLAASLIVAGIRNAATAVVATATLAALVGWGGLGRYIIDGFAQGSDGKILGGAILVALLAIITEVALGLLERAVRPKGAWPPQDEPLIVATQPA